MILFLTITALVNIGLGIWLANYLGLAPSGAEGGFGDLSGNFRSTDFDSREESYSPSDPSSRPDPRDSLYRPSEYEEQDGAQRTPKYSDFEAESPQAPTYGQVDQEESIDSDLLAGIEQFRNQLAQLKNRGDVTSAVGAEPAG